MIQLRNQVVALRDEVNRRFFSVAKADNRGHVQWILKVKDEVERLEAAIASRKPVLTQDSIEETEPPTVIKETRLPSASEETERQAMVHGSLLSPDTPMSELDHLPRDSPLVAMKAEMKQITEEDISKLYEMVPSLNDSKHLIYDPDERSTREPDKGDLVIRNVFREFLVYKHCITL